MKNKKKIKIKVEIIVLELVIICALLGILFIKKVENYNFNSNGIYYYSGIDYIVPAGSVAKTDSKTNLVTINRKNDEPLEAQGLPVYIDNEHKMVTMQTIAYVDPISGTAEIGRIPYFAEITMDESGIIRIEKNLNKKTVTTGFLFDGEDTYVFLEDVTIDFDNYHYVLPKFSYAICSKNNWVEIMNYSTKYIEVLPIDGDVTVKDNRGIYSINLISDILNSGSAQIMLRSNLDNYVSYFEEGKQ